MNELYVVKRNVNCRKNKVYFLVKNLRKVVQLWCHILGKLQSSMNCTSKKLCITSSSKWSKGPEVNLICLEKKMKVILRRAVGCVKLRPCYRLTFKYLSISLKFHYFYVGKVKNRNWNSILINWILIWNMMLQS